MTFQEGFLSQLVGRKTVVSGDRPLSVGKVVDFVVNKPDDTFPKIDGIVVKTRDGQRFAPIAPSSTFDADGKVLLSERRADHARPRPTTKHSISSKTSSTSRSSTSTAVRSFASTIIEVARTGGTLRVVAADIGFGGLCAGSAPHEIAPLARRQAFRVR